MLSHSKEERTEKKNDLTLNTRIHRKRERPHKFFLFYFVFLLYYYNYKNIFELLVVFSPSFSIIIFIYCNATVSWLSSFTFLSVLRIVLTHIVLTFLQLYTGKSIYVNECIDKRNDDNALKKRDEELLSSYCCCFRIVPHREEG